MHHSIPGDVQTYETLVQWIQHLTDLTINTSDPQGLTALYMFTVKEVLFIAEIIVISTSYYRLSFHFVLLHASRLPSSKIFFARNLLSFLL